MSSNMSEWKNQQTNMESMNSNSLTWKSFHSYVGLPEVWMQNLQSIGSASGHLLKGMPEGWKMHNMNNNNTSQLSNLFNNQNSNGSMSILPEMFDTLSVRAKNKQYNALPSEWMNAPPTPTSSMPEHSPPVQPARSSPSDFLNMNKRPMENGMFPDENQQSNVIKVPRHDSSDPRTQFQNIPAETPYSLPRHSPDAEIKIEAANGSLRSYESSVSAVKTESMNAAGARWNSWSHEEEIFLVVSVLDRFFRRGSLASSGKGANSANVDCWAEIKKMYDRICSSWHKLAENNVAPPLIARSTSALCRHFKIMKVRASEGDSAGTFEGNFRKYLREWDTIYNLNGKLIPDEY